jgi:hemerythrin-like domain-containing protein
VPRSRTKSSLDAIDMLMQDHDKVEKALKDFERTDRQDAETCRRLVQMVCEELKTHTTLEEEIFYPAVREAIADEDLLNEANYFATFTVLGEYVRHHIREEQGEMFPAAKRAKVDLAALGERMRARKDELTKEVA